MKNCTEILNILREEFPDIPMNCDWLKLELRVNEIPHIECGYFPTGKVEDEK